MKIRDFIKILLPICLCAVILAACGNHESGDTGDVSSDPAGSELSATMTDLSDVTGDETEASDVLPSGYETVEDNGVTYAVYDDHAVILSARYEPIIVTGTVNGVPVTGIIDGAFDSMFGDWRDDPFEVRIYADSDSFLYDYAASHGHRFYGFYTDGVPVCYVPERDTDVVERDTSQQTKYTAPDESEKITRLVTQYLSDGTGYDELIETVYFQYVCANELWTHIANMSSFYATPFTDESGEVHYINFAVTDKSHTVLEYQGEYHFYEKVKFGELDTYTEFEEYIRDHFSSARADDILDWCADVNGDLYYYVDGGGGGCGDPWVREPEISLTVTADAITLTAKRRIYLPLDDEDGYYEKFTGEYETHDFLLILEDGKWKWDSRPFMYYCSEEYESGSYTLK